MKTLLELYDRQDPSWRDKQPEALSEAKIIEDPVFGKLEYEGRFMGKNKAWGTKVEVAPKHDPIHFSIYEEALNDETSRKAFQEFKDNALTITRNLARQLAQRYNREYLRGIKNTSIKRLEAKNIKPEMGIWEKDGYTLTFHCLSNTSSIDEPSITININFSHKITHWGTLHWS